MIFFLFNLHVAMLALLMCHFSLTSLFTTFALPTNGLMFSIVET